VNIFGACALKIAFTRNTFQPKMHQISFGGRAPPEPAGGTYSAPPGPLAGLRGLLLREGGREGIGGDKKEKGKGKGEEGGGRERERDCRGEENISCKPLWFLSHCVCAA